MTGPWVGDLVLGPDWLRYTGPVVSTDRHAHHAVQIIDAAEPVTLIGADAEEATCLAIIPADAEHEFRATGQHAVLTYLEPTLVVVEGGIRPADWSRIARSLALDVGPGSPEEDVRLLLQKVGAGSKTVEDALMAMAVEEVRGRLPGTIRLSEIAAALAMSPSRLTHRFTAARGIPLSRWVLWERLHLAAAAIATKSDLTTAAHAAGFADSSHLHRTFRRMFGVAPSDVASVARWTVVV